MIVGKDVCKSFEGFKALDNASFHVRKGSVYGLVGPNGAGKDGKSVELNFEED